MTDPHSDLPKKDRFAVKSHETSYPPKKEIGKVGGGNLNNGTLYSVRCPNDECDWKGKLVAWHGWNSYYECYCGQIIQMVG